MIIPAIIILYFLRKKPDPGPAGIVHTKYKITGEDFRKSLHGSVNTGTGPIELYFKDEVANQHTLEFFNILQSRFKDMDYLDHLRAARDYIYENIHPAERAEQMYKLYERYNEYQKELFLNQKRWNASGTPEEMLKNLREIQNFRREHFGMDTADAVFGVEVQSNEYALRKQLIIGESGMTGKEKEERLASLRREMWGDQADTIDTYGEPRERYLEKLKIYETDLAAMSEAEREQKLREFRSEIFTPEEAERMENADRQMKVIKDRDREYSRLSKTILDNREITEAEKNRRIRELHTKIYGEQR